MIRREGAQVVKIKHTQALLREWSRVLGERPSSTSAALAIPSLRDCLPPGTTSVKVNNILRNRMHKQEHSRHRAESRYLISSSRGEPNGSAGRPIVLWSIKDQRPGTSPNGRPVAAIEEDFVQRERVSHLDDFEPALDDVFGTEWADFVDVFRRIGGIR